MNRKGFLGMLTGIAVAPFVKKNPIAPPPTMRLQDFERATFTNPKECQEEFLKELRGKFVIKGEDLIAVLNQDKKYLRRG